jgi:hypothetical protein
MECKDTQSLWQQITTTTTSFDLRNQLGKDHDLFHDRFVGSAEADKIGTGFERWQDEIDHTFSFRDLGRQSRQDSAAEIKYFG